MNCTYCGALSDSLDHVRPRSYDNTRSCSRKRVVPCCRACNSLLGDKLFLTIADRAAYLQGALAYHHRKLLALPDWTADELEDMGEGFRRNILAKLREKNFVQYRMRNCELVALTAPTFADVWSYAYEAA